MKQLSDWIAYLEQLNPYHIELGLDRVKKVAEKAGINGFSAPIVTVTGTNGKGSCVAFLEAIYSAQGYRVGSYTSPHLFRFNERIRINNEEIQDEILANAFEAIDSLKDDIFLTYFEFTTLAALKIFQAANLDVIILEVGLGGRLDAVNIVDADLAIISTIGLDHCEWLGNTREQIGHEKAGIFRKDKKAICGDEYPPQSVLARAKELDVELLISGQDFGYEVAEKNWTWWCQGAHHHLVFPTLAIENAATALAAIHCIQNVLPVTQASINHGISKASLIGRYQQLGQTIFDVGHNPHAAHWIANKLRQTPIKGHTIAILGMMQDKDIQGTIEALSAEIDCWYWGDLPPPRGAKAQQITDNLQQIKVKKWYNYPSVSEAYKAAKAVCTNQDRMVVLGSFLTVAECLKSAGYLPSNLE